MSIESQLLKYISTEVVQGDQNEVTLDEPLVESGRIDSMGLLMIFGFVDQVYQFDMMSVGSPKDFTSISAMAALIRRIKGED